MDADGSQAMNNLIGYGIEKYGRNTSTHILERK